MYKKAAHYTLVPALRLVNPLTVLARFARLRKGEEDTLGAFLQRDYGPLLGECDVEAVASSIEVDAAEITAILESYRPEDLSADGEDDDPYCYVCDGDGEPCRVRFENDAQDVAMEADAPLLAVMTWMHAGELSSLSDGITSMAEAYIASLGITWRSGRRRKRSASRAEEAERQRKILDKYRPIFFGK